MELYNSSKNTVRCKCYFFTITIHKKALIDQARTSMLEKSNLVGSSKAVIRETVEITHTFFPFVRKYNVTVSGYVIEFTE